MKVYSRDLREKVLKAYNDKEGSMRALSERFMVSLKFVFTLIKRFKQNGHINPKPHGGGRRSATDETGCQFIMEAVKCNADLTLEELCSRYDQKFSKKVGKSTMDRTLKKMNITRKKKRCMIPAEESGRVKQLTKEYIEDIESEPVENLRFIDETGLVLNMTLPYGRSLKGGRAYDSRPVSQGQRISTTGALSAEGPAAGMSYEGTLNGGLFLYFLVDFLVPQLQSGGVVICDNAASHKAADVKELIESKGAGLVYLLPYPPDLPPIELYWSKFKQFLKKSKARTKENLHQAISNSINTITKEAIKGWFEHCGYVIE